MTHTDNFWRLFWFSLLGATLFYVLLIGILTYFYNPISTADAEAVGIVYNASKDPFVSARPINEIQPNFTGEYLYRDGLPIALADWSWGVKTDWNSSERVFEGSRALKIIFLQNWSGARAAAAEFNLHGYEGISLAVFPDSRVGDLYLELYDTYGKSLGRQSIGWYAPGSKLQPEQWNTVTIPLANLMPEGQAVQPITGFSIDADVAGSAYVDAVRLEKTAAAFPRWHEPQVIEEPPAPPIDMPYSLAITEENASLWRKNFGRFDVANSGVHIGPIAHKTTGSMSYLAGGKHWKNYRVDAIVYWGPVETFSILVRYKDDGNFISCAFGDYGYNVSIFQVKNGESTRISGSPGLAIRTDEPWKDARHGAMVDGNTISCLQDGDVVLRALIPDMPDHGTVGLESWTRNSQYPPHTLKSLTVTPL